MTGLRKVTWIGRGCAILGVALALGGCNDANTWIDLKDGSGVLWAKAGIRLPQQGGSIPLGTEQTHCTQLFVPAGSGVKTNHIEQYLTNRVWAWDSPGQGTGDFENNWAAGPTQNMPCYWQWLGTAAPPDVEPTSGDVTKSSRGSFTPTKYPNCNNPGCQSGTHSFQVLVWATVHTWDGNVPVSLPGGPYSVPVSQ